MRLLEYEAKQVLRPFGFALPCGVIIRQLDEIAQALSGLSFPAMIKAQVPIGGRGKVGAVVQVPDLPAARGVITQLLSGQVRGHAVEGVLVEARIPIRREFFLAVAYDTVAKQVVLLASGAGGIDVEAATRTASGGLVRRSVDPRRGLYNRGRC